MRWRLALYISTTVLLATAALALASWQASASEGFLDALAALFLLGLLSESSSISLRLGSATSSVAFIPFLAAIMLVGPGWAMLIAGLTFIVVETVIRRKSWIKVAFNTSKEVLAVGVAGFSFQLLGGRPSLTDFDFSVLPIFGAIVAYLAIGHLAVCRVVSLSEGVSFGDAWTRIGGSSVGYDLCSSVLAPLLAYLYTQFQIVGVAALVLPLFFVRHLYHMYRQLEQVNRELLELMVKSIEARDPYTSGHSQRVCKYARIVAREAGLAPKAVEQVATAALLHDVGKIYEEYAPVLRKEGELTVEERAIMQSHPSRSAELVGTVSSLRGIIERSVRHHHENFDGSGYPDGLAGEAIPIGARIVMIADTLDAMTTDRPYRRALSFDRVIAELTRYSGKQFDPHLVQVTIHSEALRSLLADRLPHTPPSELMPTPKSRSLSVRGLTRRTTTGPGT